MKAYNSDYSWTVRWSRTSAPRRSSQRAGARRTTELSWLQVYEQELDMMARGEDLSLSVAEEKLSRRPRRRREALLRGASAWAWGIKTGRWTTGSRPLGGLGR